MEKITWEISILLDMLIFLGWKDQLLNNNDIESEVIKFGMIKITRIYNDFNSNENNRVIKSFQHSRKKYEEFND